ncbi:MAG TPA: signal peptidase I [Candidatus Merdivicinus intestinavium]|nr:signal peptidase I [Candidatus Merdivicinus intestinavium]
MENVSAAEQKDAQKEPFNLKKELWEWAKAILFAAVIVFIVFRFIIQVVTVNGVSMEPTLEGGDRLIISNLFYTPAAGDIVVLSDETGLDEALIKRIIALPGQTVDINENGEVLVDGKVLSEPYIAERIDENHRGDMTYPLTVPEDSVFVMGDNRNHSTDSRDSQVGLVDEGEILGRVIFRLLPLSKIGPVD